MNRFVRILSVAIIIVLAIPSFPVSAVAPAQIVPPDNCEVFTEMKNGAVYALCLPTDMGQWNHDLVIFAHGYVFAIPGKPVDIPWDQMMLPDQSTSIPEMVTSLNFAFATTSYRKDGLAVQEGIEDILDLVEWVKSLPELSSTNRIYLVGVSEGGLITTLSIERHPKVYSGGLSVCAPVGDFRKQVNYWGDFRVVFDYFFKDTLPPSPVKIPAALPADLFFDWAKPDSVYQAAVVQAITTNPGRLDQLLTVARAAVDPADSSTKQATTLGILTYNVMATNEAMDELGGVQPYGNLLTVYRGSSDDTKLNAKVERIATEGNIFQALAPYQTSGYLRKPLISLHTTLDPIVPFWHQSIYRTKTLMSGSLLKFIGIPIQRYGHCAINGTEALYAFGLLVLRASFQPIPMLLAAPTLKAAGDQGEFEALNQTYGDITQTHQYLPMIQQ